MTVSVFSTAPVEALLICTVSLRAVVSQSRKYNSRSCVWPSVRFTSTVKLENEYQQAAMRPEPPATWTPSGRMQEQLDTTCNHAPNFMFSVISKVLSRSLGARLTGCTIISSEY